MATSLKKFLAELAVDPAKLEAYLRDADAAMEASNLNHEDRALLKNAGAAALNYGLAAPAGGQAVSATHTIAISGPAMISITITPLDGGSRGDAFAVTPLPPITVHPPITVRPPPPPITVHPPITVRPQPRSKLTRGTATGRAKKKTAKKKRA